MRIPFTPHLTLADAARITGGTALGSPFTLLPSHLVTDSREVEPGDLFCALRGRKEDGEKYLTDAAMRGAGMLLSPRAPVFPHPPALLCKDPMAALTALAAYYASNSPHKTVAITGSVGKTTSRRCVAAALSSVFRVHAAEKNYNNALGVPLTLLSMPRGTEVLVAEAGTGAPGELLPLSNLLSPDIAVITRIGSAHIGAFGNSDALIREKLSIALGMKPNGILLLPKELEDQGVPLPSCKRIAVSCRKAERGFSVEPIFYRSESTTLDFFYEGEHKGRYHVAGFGLPALSAAAVALSVGTLLGLSEELLRAGLSCHVPPEGRGNAYRARGITLVNDGYNAAPESMETAFERLAFCAPTEHRVAFLGNMEELGDATAKIHRRIGALFARLCGGRLFLTGCRAGEYAEGALEGGLSAERITHLPSGKRPVFYAERLLRELKMGDCVLFKGAHTSSAEDVYRATAELLSTPSEDSAPT